MDISKIIKNIDKFIEKYSDLIMDDNDNEIGCKLKSISRALKIRERLEWIKKENKNGRN